ncbi:MAG: hypothetical protein GY820_10580 [Gammaproteobacteria bacterium]|nr:hypothetical protein [Gammaproteobacteria bacterium]
MRKRWYGGVPPYQIDGTADPPYQIDGTADPPYHLFRFRRDFKKDGRARWSRGKMDTGFLKGYTFL